MVKDPSKTTTTIDIDIKVLAEFSYLVNVLEKPKKRNQVIEEMLESYNNKKRKQV